MTGKFVHTSDYPIVHTADGALHGYEWNGLLCFRGIRYATARRFHMPEPAAAWEGVKKAVMYGPTAPVYGQQVPRSEFYVPHRYWPTDEDCLYLNVWAPADVLKPDTGEQAAQPGSQPRRRPVLVWIHGGGFSTGSALEGVSYDGDLLASFGDAVVVSVNHRLNILGYLDLSAYGEEYRNSVNAGIADLVEALRWVRRNISAFGGDPDNVTIFGQSGGGGKVISLLQVPEAAGLFHKGIIISGAANLVGSGDQKPCIDEMLNILNISPEHIAELETVPYDILMQAFMRAEKKVGARISWGPVKNDWYLGYPVTEGFSDYAKKVPLVVGSNIGEFLAYAPPLGLFLSDEEKRSRLQKLYGEHTDEIIEAFLNAYPDKDISLIPNVDVLFRPGTLEFTQKRAEECPDAPTYAYMFALTFDIGDATLCWHSGDIPFFMHNTCRIPNANIEGVTPRLEEETAGSVIAFARTGDPNHACLAHWKPYTKDEKNVMILDRTSALRTAPDEDLVAMLKKYGPVPHYNRPHQDAEETQPTRVWLY